MDTTNEETLLLRRYMAARIEADRYAGVVVV